MTPAARAVLWPALLLACIPASGAAAQPRQSLGTFGEWGAFADARAGTCYAIAMARPDPRARERQPYATVSVWPERGISGQVFWQLARTARPGSYATAQIGTRRFALALRGADAWLLRPDEEPAFRAALRGARSMTVSYRDTNGRFYTERYALDGAPSAMDAAQLGCMGKRVS
ncbi:hypothetical protein EYB45_08120 [Erythrobacteraceae bacterium CFH 75059]|uniref:hypothetical protein n=1 Tax=Qipengyuania thermophila TaxID=2509361 RepID=UPI0010202F5E|nr:hypothetical protein [Qipengyuania thermophila]TCD05426.1 hypothetical protein EYB45_08120 [Erythrobacteraceae bacterium CFH 75059]